MHGIYSTHIPAVRIAGPTNGTLTLIGESAGGISEPLYCFASASFDSMTVSSAAVMMSPWASSANYIQMKGGLLQMTGGTVTEWVWDDVSSRHVESAVVKTPHLYILDALGGTITVTSASIGYGILYGDTLNILSGGTVGTAESPFEIAGGTVTVFSSGTIYYAGNSPVDSGGTIISAGYGFICGAYMPIASFSEGLQKVISLLPGTYGTCLIKNHMMRGVFEAMEQEGFPPEIMTGIKKSVDFNISFFGKSVSVPAMYAVLAGSVAAFTGLFVLFHILKKRAK